MNRMFYNLPDPRGVGLKWKPYEQAREKVERIEERLHRVKNERARLEEEIRQLDAAGVRDLAAAVLAGDDDPAADHGEHEKLVARLRDSKRQTEAIQQALPRAEEELRQTVFGHQGRWKEEADKELGKAIEEERAAYAKAEALISEPRAKRLYLEALAAWVRYPAPTFGANADTAIPTALSRLQADVYAAEQRIEERRYNEQAEAEQNQHAEQGVA
jgi:hypothetical protein